MQNTFVLHFLSVFVLIVTATLSYADANRTASHQIEAYEKYLTKKYKGHIDELTELISIPTLSMVKENAKDVIRGARFLEAKLHSLGMSDVKVHLSRGLPFVTAEWMEADGQPTVLFYGHFDVQPVVRENWKTDPFKAELRDGKLFGRGATDDKGFIISLLSSIEAIMAIDGKLPVNVKFIFDGAEESGSLNMKAWLADSDVNSWIKEADYGFNVDAMMHSDDQGLMWRGFRGGGDVEVIVTSANTAVHSGIFGGSAPNAIHAASRIISSMYKDDGSIAIEGFQDGLIQPTQELRGEIKAVEPDLAATLDKEKLGIAQWIGDPNYTVLERTWIRNSLDVTGIKGGYAEGKASIVAATAWFRLMYRTGPGQDPETIEELIKTHVNQHAPWGVAVDMTSFIGGSSVYFDDNDPAFRIACAVLTDVLGQEPKVALMGGSVPAVSHIHEAGGPKLVSFGFQRSDEGFHAANEYLRVASFKTGQRAYLRLLHALAEQPKTE